MLGPNQHQGKGSCTVSPPHETQSQGSGKVTLEWIRSWDLEAQSNNPPCRDRIPPALEYLRRYAMVAADVPLQGSSESLQTNNRRIYDTLHTMLRAVRDPRNAHNKTMATHRLVDSVEKCRRSPCVRDKQS